MVLLFCWCVVYLFSSRISLFSVANKRTENLKITLESKTALGVQQKLGLLEQQTSLLIVMELLYLRPANFSSNRNVALDARGLGPPCSGTMLSDKQSEHRFSPSTF